MSNPLKPRPLDAVIQELIKMGADPFGPTVRLMQDLTSRADLTTTNTGQIQSVAPIKGRTEGIAVTVTGLAPTGDILAATKVVGRTEGLGTTTGNLDATGKLTSTDAIAADGTGSPLTGGKRGFAALDTNNRLVGSFRANAVNVSSTPTAATALSNDGVLTVIPVAATTAQFGDGSVSYNSGSVDPGVFGTFYVFADDPTFSGGAVTYQFSTTPVTQTAANGRVLFGKIITVLGTPKTGGGNTGGTTPGGGGGRGFIQ